MTREVLPAVALTDAPDRPLQECRRPGIIDGRKCETEGTLLGPQYGPAGPLIGPRLVAQCILANARRSKYVKLQSGVTGQCELDQQHVARGIGADLQRQAEPFMTVIDGDGGDRAVLPCHRIVSMAPQLHPEAGVVADDEAHVLQLRNVRAREIHLGHDALGHREPEPGGAQCRADSVLRSRCPSRVRGGRCGRASCGRRRFCHGHHHFFGFETSTRAQCGSPKERPRRS